MHSDVKMKPSFVLDTNVFLADPLAIYSFPGSNVLIPDIVLSELDRLKTSKMDKRVRYRGRQVSRILFGLSERGMLLEGISVEDGTTVRVVALDQSVAVPPTLNPKNSDDRILAVAHQVADSGEEVTLVTNDLNMLLKAQTLELPVRRYGEDEERSFSSRVLQAFKRNRAVTAAALLGVIALAFAIAALLGVSITNSSSPPSFPGQGQAATSSAQAQEFQLRQALEQNPKDLNAWIGLGNLYYDLGTSSGSQQRFSQAAQAYTHALTIQPANPDVRVDMAISLYRLGEVDKAVSEARLALKYSPDHPLAHLNLGVFYFKGKKDDVSAVRELNAAIKSDKVGNIAATARDMLQEIRVQERQGGK